MRFSSGVLDMSVYRTLVFNLMISLSSKNLSRLSLPERNRHRKPGASVERVICLNSFSLDSLVLGILDGGFIVGVFSIDVFCAGCFGLSVALVIRWRGCILPYSSLPRKGDRLE